MRLELGSSVVFFLITSGLSAWFLYRVRNWVAFWRNKQPVTLQAVKWDELQHFTSEDGHLIATFTKCLTYRALDGPMAGAVLQSAVTTEPPIMKIGEETEGFCDPVLQRMESKKALWIIYGILLAVALVLGFFWLESFRWVLFEFFTRVET